MNWDNKRTVLSWVEYCLSLLQSKQRLMLQRELQNKIEHLEGLIESEKKKRKVGKYGY
jgi:hypothetical protein